MLNTKPATLTDDYLRVLEEGGLPHPQIVVRLHGEDVLIDEELVEIIKILNSCQPFYTVSCCQGFPSSPDRTEWSGHIAIRVKGNYWKTLGKFAFDDLCLLMAKADTWHELILNNESEPTLWIMFANETIPLMLATLREIFDITE